MLDRIRGRSIASDESPFWTNTTFVRPHNTEKRSGIRLMNKTFATPINPSFYIDQFSPQAFTEFDGLSQSMREHGCGIVSLHNIIGTLSLDYKANTVGTLALFALDFHRNDLKDDDGKLLKKGTPVLAQNVGWYHDALLHVARQFKVDGHRIEGVDLENVANEFVSLVDNNKKPLCIISVKDNYKRPQLESRSSHLIVASGFKFNLHGNLSEIMITDPSSYVCNGKYINEWVNIVKITRDTFLRKAMFFYTNK